MQHIRTYDTRLASAFYNSHKRCRKKKNGAVPWKARMGQKRWGTGTSGGPELNLLYRRNFHGLGENTSEN